MKDWTGDKQSQFVTLGASSHSLRERASRDYYATPPRAIEAVLSYLNKDIPIWECACGEGHLSIRLKELGYRVRESDIIVRSHPCEEKDFLWMEEHAWDGDILTNPPFAMAKEFAERGIETLKEGRKLFLFLRVQFLESQKRRGLFEKYPPKYVLVYSKRTPQCARNGDFSQPTGNAAMYCWFIWEKGWRGEAVIRWI